MTEGLRRFLVTVLVLAVVGYAVSVLFERLDRPDEVSVDPASESVSAAMRLSGLPEALAPGEGYGGTLYLPPAPPGTRVFVSARGDGPALLDLDLQVCEPDDDTCHSVGGDTFTYGSTGPAELAIKLGISAAAVGQFGVLRDTEEIEIFYAISGPDSIWNPFDEDFPQNSVLGTFGVDKSSVQ